MYMLVQFSFELTQNQKDLPSHVNSLSNISSIHVKLEKVQKSEIFLLASCQRERFRVETSL